MHAVGIKRVSWTNDDGGLEGCKVAKFIDALDGDGDGGWMRRGSNGEWRVCYETRGLDDEEKDG